MPLHRYAVHGKKIKKFLSTVTNVYVYIKIFKKFKLWKGYGLLLND